MYTNVVPVDEQKKWEQQKQWRDEQNEARRQKKLAWYERPSFVPAPHPTIFFCVFVLFYLFLFF